ncbi:hypothetical protein QE152_g23096 [Popillia japonica]|uniref:Uncharacterized protein n=1 Tax=Popillia japonica TaxID=7064 RepID=A0AAW1KIB8_POPJA
MQVILYLILVIFSGVSAEIQLGEPCGNNIGEITLGNNCTTAIILTNITSATKDDGSNTNNMVCCIKSSLLPEEKEVTPDKKPMRKSEEACAKFGPGIRRNLSSSDHVLPGDYQHNVALIYESGHAGQSPKVCNGVLINEYFVLTTAFCANPKWQFPVFKIRAGTTDMSGEEDVAVPQQTDVPDMMTATGWGLKSLHDTKASNILLRSKVIEVNTIRCNNTAALNYKYVYDSEFCGITDYNICNIGFGSPVFLSNKEDSRVILVAIESYGVKCPVTEPSITVRTYIPIKEVVMQAVLGLVLVILSAILAQVEIGDPCGENVGQITKIQDCTTAIIVPDFNGGKNNWWNTPDMVCCVNTSYLTPNRRPIRKSEEACAKFGPAIQRKVSSENYVQPGDYQHNVAIGYWDDREDSGIIWGICCGVLISEDYVVTTATCITIPGKAPPKIRAGTIDSLGEEDGVKPQDIDVLETVAKHLQRFELVL